MLVNVKSHLLAEVGKLSQMRNWRKEDFFFFFFLYSDFISLYVCLYYQECRTIFAAQLKETCHSENTASIWFFEGIFNRLRFGPMDWPAISCCGTAPGEPLSG